MKKGICNIEKKFYKTNPRGGVSLIVLVITIIVVIILATAIIISMQNNNPMEEANEARIQIDRDNIQSMFTNTVGKIMAEKQEVIEIVPNRLNEPASNKKGVVGEVVYKIGGKEAGKIIFDNANNDGVNYYTGKKLPVYKKETIWYVDEQGIIKLQIGEKVYIEEGRTEGTPDANDTAKLQIDKEPSDWTKGNVKLKLTSTVEMMYTPQYSEDGETYVDIGKVYEVEIEENKSVYVRFVNHDGKEVIGNVNEIVIDNIDRKVPTINSVELENSGPVREAKIIAKAIDEQSGIVAYQLSKNSILDENSEGWESIGNTNEEITKEYVVKENGTYYFYVKDKLGNVNKNSINVSNIDLVAPTLENINVTSPESGTYKAGEQVTIVATYSDNIKGIMPVLKVKFGNGTEKTTVAKEITGNKITYTYTIAVGDNGILTSTSYRGSITDIAGNSLIVENKELGGNVITADTIAPTLENINVTSPESGTYKAGEQVTMVATYSENIKGAVPVLKIKFGEGEEKTATAGKINGRTITYTYTIVEGDNGELSSTSYSGSVTDIVGNSLTVENKILGGNAVTADTIAPTLENINVTAPENGTYKAGEQVTIVATYSENIRGTAPVLKIKFGDSEERTATAVEISGRTITYTYTVVEGDNGELESTSYSGSVIDIAGNSLTVGNKILGGNTVTVDTIAPTDTEPTLVSNTNSITATFKQVDGLSGINRDTIQYAIKKESDSEWGQWRTNSEDTYTFLDLVKYTTYEVKTKVIDIAGNEKESQVASIKTVDITKPTLSASSEWTNDSVIVTITYPNIEGTTKEYSTDGTNWTSTTESIKTVEVSTNNTTVYARLIDNTNQTSGNATYEVTNIDKEIPEVEIGTNGGEYEIKAGSTSVNMTTSLSASDTGGSGIEVLEYQISKSETVPEESDTGWKKFKNGENITEALEGGTNYLYTKVKDKAGNRATSIQKSNAYIVRYEVKYNANGGSTAPEKQTKTHEEELTLSSQVLTKTGYTFKGWSSTNNATTAEYSAGGKYTENEAVELYAIFEKNSYTVTYNYSENGGTTSTKTSDSVKYQDAIDMTPTATKTGYTFIGWNTNKDATDKLTSLTMNTSNVTLYAIYRKEITGIFYYFNGSQAATKTVTGYAYNKATSTSIKTPALANTTSGGKTCSQRGWSTANGADSAISVGGNAAITVSSNLTYYASYTYTVSVSYNVNGGTPSITASTATAYMNYAGTKKAVTITIKTTKPTKSGYTFTGWKNGTTVVGTTISTSADVTLVAQYIVSVTPGTIVKNNAVTYVDADGDKAVIPINFAIVPGKTDISKGLVISDVANDTGNTGNQFVWVPVTNINTFVREEGYESGSLQSMLKNCSEPLSGTSSVEITEYNKMKASVQEYKGFYIGRYEMSNNGSDKAQVKKNKVSWTNIKWGNSSSDQTGGIVEKARAMYPEASATKGKVVSTLVYGVCWDETVRFIKKNYSGIEKDSHIYGNYPNSGSKINTGSNESYVLNNIYDMAGNVWEWTMEANSTTERVIRGGSFNYYYGDGNYGKTKPISTRSAIDVTKVAIFQTSSGRWVGHLGGRVQLYIK